MLSHNPSLALALILALGIASQWLAWRVRLPAILPLLLVGFLVGPILNLIEPSELIGGLFYPGVALAVGLILFEGGMTLRWREVSEVRRVVVGLVTVGALITWVLAAFAAHFIVGLELPLAFLFGALVIVTGPTVIGPLIRTVRPTAQVANVLKWEGILIDPIGALVAVLVYEFLIIENREALLTSTLWLFGKFVVVGSLVGIAGGIAVAFMLRRRLVPDYLLNVITLAFVFGVFALSGALAHESGLLATVVMGMFLANQRISHLEHILSFKEDLSILFISVLFVTLAAEVELSALLAVLDWRSFLLLAVIMLLIRPLNVFASTLRSPLSLQEKAFLSWIAPRGIVAASVTSLFAFRLSEAGYAGVDILSPLVFLVIVGTVTLNSLTAKPLARFLGIAEPDPQGFLVLGAHPFARRIALALKEAGVSVLVADTNAGNILAARSEGLATYYGSPLSEHSNDGLRLSGIGKLLALTSNDEANALTALKYAREFGSSHVYRLAPRQVSNEQARVGAEQKGRIIFGEGTTYARLSELFANGARIETFELGDAPVAEVLPEGALPMFVLDAGKVRVLADDQPEPEGDEVVALVPEAA